VALALPGRDGSERTRARERMARFSMGLRRGLAALGIEAAFRGKNDLEVGGRKLAGLGLHRDSAGGLLFHASLLVDLDVRLMARVLRTPFVELSEAELATVARRTSTVRELAGDDVSMADVREQVARGFASAFDVALEPGALDSDEQGELAALARDKYASRDWVFQRSDVPDSSGSASLETPGGRLEVSVALAGRLLKAVHVRGSFIENEEALAELEARLRWTPADEEAVAAVVLDWSRARATGTMEAGPLTHAVVSAAQRARGEPEPYGCFVSPGGRA